MIPFIKGALVEYQIENGKGVIISELRFQFNPEKLQRSLQIPTRPTQKDVQKESNQAGDIPLEKLSITIYLNSAEKTNLQDQGAMDFGIAPELNLLEKYSQPHWVSQTNGVNFVEKHSTEGKENKKSAAPEAAQVREEYPRILFVWGESRIVPVAIESYSVNEVQFDSQLNPTQAEVSLGLTVISRPDDKDTVAVGARKYSKMKIDQRIEMLKNKTSSSGPSVDLYRLESTR